ncbi:MAG: heme lyase CcmF/NrfE family subunit [Alphaproteobacteria bacterium]
MISEIGFLLLLLVMIISSLSFIEIIFAKTKLEIFKIDQRRLSNTIFPLTLVSFFCLIYAFINSDFSLNVISQNSNSQLPLVYKFTGVWGNHEGSIFLWLLVMTFFGFLFSTKSIANTNFKKETLKIQNSLCFLITSFIVFTSNPFEKTFPPAVEGADLNPLLQDPGLVIHPPFLYLGYVGFSIIYSISMAALSTKSSQDFIKTIKPWAFLSWIFLTCGIGLGSWWAYYELGWGGFWFWDPVENASLLPWLTASALLHTIVIAEKKKVLINWTIILAIMTFVLSLLGTFLVRSGVLVSVHAFANDPTRGIYILMLLASICSYGVYKYAVNSHKVAKSHQIALISREGMISLNNIFMLSLTFTILVGTIYPLFSSVIFNSKISVGAPFFNSILAPVMFPFVIGMILGPYVRWGNDDLILILNRMRVVIVVFFITSLFVWYVNYKDPILSIIFITLGCWIVISSIFEIFQFSKVKNWSFIFPKKIIAQVFAHIGIGLLIIGATGSSILKQEKIQFQNVGESILIENFDVTFLGVKKIEGPNFISQTGYFEITQNEKKIKILKPEKRFYNSGKQVTTEAAIYSTIFGDLYIAIGEVHENKKQWTTRIWFNPFTIWIWIGVLFLALGGVFSFINSIERKR